MKILRIHNIDHPGKDGTYLSVNAMEALKAEGITFPCVNKVVVLMVLDHTLEVNFWHGKRERIVLIEYWAPKWAEAVIEKADNENPNLFKLR